METKLNIAEILDYKPRGTKLYTDAFGELRIEDICTEDELGITLSSKDDDELLFYNDGKYNRYGEPILFPSKEMRDWSKFAWKKGDVLVSLENTALSQALFYLYCYPFSLYIFPYICFFARNYSVSSLTVTSQNPLKIAFGDGSTFCQQVIFSAVCES